MAYASAEGGYGAGSSVLHLDTSHPDQVSIPDAELLFTGDFKRHGPDLILTGHDGRHHVVPGYFSGPNHPALVAPNGASLSADLVDLLAGSPAPGQYAQTQPTMPADAIGKIEKVVGQVVVMRNGVAVALNVGDAVYKSDVIQTGANSSCGVSFPDGTALNLVANTRMALNEYSFDPNSHSNEALFSLVQGTFAFVAGQVAHTGDMKIETPVATMGIRGTTGYVEEQIGTITANVGSVTYSFAVVEDNGTGRVGQYELIDANGHVVATVSQSGFLTYLTPQGPNLAPIVTTQPMSNAQLGFEQQIIQQVFQVLNAGTNPNPQTNPNNSSPGSSTPPDQLHNNLPQLLQNNGQQLTITVTTTGGGSTTGTATVNTTTTTQQNTTTTGPSDFDLASGTQTISDNETVNNLTIGAGAILTIINPGSLTVLGIADNGGTINVNSTVSDPLVHLVGPVTVEIGGAITANGAASSISLLNNIVGNSGTIYATNNGTVTFTNETITNQATIQADTGGAVTIENSTVTNTGSIEANVGGAINIDHSTIDNAGGAIQANGASALVNLSDAIIEGGTLSTSGPGSSIDVVVSANGAGDPNMSVLDGTANAVTIAGYVGIFQGAQLELKGTIHVDGANGEIDVGGPSGGGDTATTTNLLISGDVTIDTDGLNTTTPQISLDGSATDTVSIKGATGGGTLDNFGTISGSGQIGDFGQHGATSLALVNETGGVIDATTADSLTIDTGQAVSNTGTLEANAGSLIVDDAVIGTGSETISNNGLMLFESSVSGGQTITFADATGMLALADPTDFNASVGGFGVGDVVDLTNTAYSSTEYAVWTQVSTSDGGAGKLQIYNGDGALEETLNLNGIYAQNAFTLTQDNTAAHGTDVDLSFISFSDGTINYSNNSGADYSGPQISNDGSTLTLTNDSLGEYGSWFSNNAYSVTSFTASFDYQATGRADGLAFVLQDDPRGSSALGTNFVDNGGSGLGYTGISPSAAIELNIYSGHVQGTNFAIDGSTGTYYSTGNVPLDGNGDVIQVVLSYNGSVLTESLTDLVTGATYSTSYTENLSAILGSGTAYVGFTAGTGGAASTQTVSNFTFESDAAVAVDPTVPPGTSNVVGNIAVADSNPADTVTASVTPDGANYVGTFSLDPVTQSNGTASVGFEFNLGNDQIKLAPEETLTQSYAVAVTDPQNPAVNVEQTVSVSIGGPGNDNFVFAPGIGADTIVNFNPKADTIELDHFANIQNIQELASSITTDVHGDAVIELGHNDSITLPGVAASYLQAHLQSLVHLH